MTRALGIAAALFFACAPVATRDSGLSDAASSDTRAPSGDGSPSDSDAATIVVGEEVTTVSGPIVGERSGDLVIFRGIPYASPPVGPLRFRPPTAPPAWTNPRRATTFGPVCPQLTGTPAAYTGNEDCLTLNVWAHASGGSRPVMVFIHGGGFIEGAGSIAWYEGSSLAAATGAIVVTLNYRLGPLGFLATDALVQESPAHTAGNYGLLDQVYALAWIQLNAAAFGGDPQRVMVFGESAGGASVCALLTMPVARPYFQSAAIESGPCTLFPALRDAGPNGASALDIGAQFVSLAGCASATDPLQCLRQLPPNTLITAQRMLPWTNTVLLPITPMLPTVDGVVVRSSPIDSLRAGDLGDVPLIVGSNADEAATFLAAAPDTETYYRTRLDERFGATVGAQLFALYPPADFGGPRAALTQIAGDLAFNCAAESIADAASGGNTRSYLYYLTRGWTTGPWAGRGAVHGIDLFHVFDSYTVIGQVPEAGDLALRDAVQRAWGSIVDGAPVLEPPWPAYDRASPQFATFDAMTTIGTAYRRGTCPHLRSLGVTP